MPTYEEIKKKRAEINEISKMYGVQNLRIFGSVAKGTPTPDSDIDRICRKYDVKKCSIFGSALSDQFGEDSDIGSRNVIAHGYDVVEDSITGESIKKQTQKRRSKVKYTVPRNSKFKKQTW